MADEPSNGELGRLIQSLRDEMREDLGNLNGRLDSFVSQDVYTIEKTQLGARVTTLETKREQDADRLVATRRWMIGVVITVIVALLPYLAMTVKGAGA
ncbi:hypothetical protein [Streptomyces fulvorobeus]|uniref:Uncharacterized protein n=1 Tax=Streptomyces fulvorobeus TaxID=284028 RepID=A0A7J0C3B8_9ACTN|nr:hypothetical protein [Streptomyces fulvorobeus]NYE40677.1 hypothetical protein [Streptomyces fulvorobeus]GFM96980.1 hypothetical protein Sfulv_17910 [Streptomyces fulvorobeus]